MRPTKPWFTRFAKWTSRATGRPLIFSLALLVILAWVVTGPLFGFSDTWQLVINTGTTIVTFLMVFLIQNAQNRDARAFHLKLDELIHAIKEARNELIDVEELSDEQLAALQREFVRLREERPADAPADEDAPVQADTRGSTKRRSLAASR
jgi:low affinity Fe/Cu permease